MYGGKWKGAGMLAALIVSCALCVGCTPKHSPSFASENMESAYSGFAPSFSAVMPKNVTVLQAKDGNYYPWVEIVNPNSEPVQLREHYLTDNANRPRQWRFPSIVLEAGESQIVFLSGLQDAEGELHAPFTLSEESNALYLFQSDGPLVERFLWEGPAQNDTVIVNQTDAAADEAAISSSVETEAPLQEPEPEQEPVPTPAPTPVPTPVPVPTLMNDTDPVVITEVLLRNDAGIVDKDGERHAWIELHNRSDAPVSLAGYVLSQNIQRLFQWVFPDMTLMPGEYLVVFLSGKDTYQDGELHASFWPDYRGAHIILTNTQDKRLNIVSTSSAPSPEIPIGWMVGGIYRALEMATPGAPNAGIRTKE